MRPRSRTSPGRGLVLSSGPSSAGLSPGPAGAATPARTKAKNVDAPRRPPDKLFGNPQPILQSACTFESLRWCAHDLPAAGGQVVGKTTWPDRYARGVAASGWLPNNSADIRLRSADFGDVAPAARFDDLRARRSVVLTDLVDTDSVSQLDDVVELLDTAEAHARLGVGWRSCWPTRPGQRSTGHFRGVPRRLVCGWRGSLRSVLASASSL